MMDETYVRMTSTTVSRPDNLCPYGNYSKTLRYCLLLFLIRCCLRAVPIANEKLLCVECRSWVEREDRPRECSHHQHWHTGQPRRGNNWRIYDLWSLYLGESCTNVRLYVRCYLQLFTISSCTLCSEKKHPLVFSWIFPRKIFRLLRKFQGMFGKY